MSAREEILKEFTKRIENQAPPTKREMDLIDSIGEAIEKMFDRWGLLD